MVIHLIREVQDVQGFNASGKAWILGVWCVLLSQPHQCVSPRLGFWFGLLQSELCPLGVQIGPI